MIPPGSNSELLKHYARALRAASPKDWEAFVEHFDTYATEVTVAVTQAEQNSILNMQGRAQAFLWLLSLFKTCHIQPPPKNPTPAPPP